ncbi:MAG: sensor histidine kinase [Bacteroidetes bacterium]|nr:MAG: sensor histidine kinase [Bacteroidota bacterium]
MFNTSLKSNLLISYSFFIILIFGVGASSFWYFLQLSEIQELQKNTFSIIINLSKLKEYETNFYENESIDSNFYITNQSKNQKLLENTILIIEDRILDINTDNNYHKKAIDSLIEKIGINLLSYRNQVDDIISLYHTKGFKDYGLEGKMRSYIHKIEKEYPRFNKITLLSTRKNEKDYIIRKDLAYVKKMNTSQKNILNEVRNDSKLTALFQGYFACFDSIVIIDSKIGFTNQSGKKLTANTYFHQITSLSADLEENVDKSLAVLKADIKVKFISLLFFTFLIAVLMSFVFRKSIVSNLDELLNAIENNKIGFFKNVPTFKKPSKIYEFKTLQNKFLQMSIAITEYTTDVEVKNKELININSLLKSSNEELSFQKKELQKLNTVKETFLSIISHDVKGPLMTLQKFLEIIINSPELLSMSEQQKHFKKLKDATDDQLILLQNLLHWSRSQSEEFIYKPANFNALKMSFDVVRLLQPMADAKKISIQNYIENENIHSDVNMTELIVRNILSNAIKYSNVGGVITIQSHITKNSKFILEIIDNGVGMAPDLLKKLNENNFFHSEEGTLKERGTGFGLMFCKSFVEKMGGSLQVDSIVGQGTSVKIMFTHISFSKIRLQKASSN